MTIYSFKLVTDLLDNLGLSSIYHNKHEWYIKLNYSELYKDIILKTINLSKPSFKERLYCYVNKIENRPLCKMCSNEVSFSKSPLKEDERKYHTYCNKSCARSDFITLIGSENPSTLDSVKIKKIETMKLKYGVENPGQLNSVKKAVSDSVKKRWADFRQNKIYTNEGLTRSQYRHRCSTYANTEYLHNKHIIDPENKRSKNWHLDHIYSVEDGFINDVPPNILSNITNLRIISDKDNYQKRDKSEKTLYQLYENYNQFIDNIQSK